MSPRPLLSAFLLFAASTAARGDAGPAQLTAADAAVQAFAEALGPESGDPFGPGPQRERLNASFMAAERAVEALGRPPAGEDARALADEFEVFRGLRQRDGSLRFFLEDDPKSPEAQAAADEAAKWVFALQERTDLRLAATRKEPFERVLTRLAGRLGAMAEAVSPSTAPVAGAPGSGGGPESAAPDGGVPLPPPTAEQSAALFDGAQERAGAVDGAPGAPVEAAAGPAADAPGARPRAAARGPAAPAAAAADTGRSVSLSEAALAALSRAPLPEAARLSLRRRAYETATARRDEERAAASLRALEALARPGFDPALNEVRVALGRAQREGLGQPPADAQSELATRRADAERGRALAASLIADHSRTSALSALPGMSAERARRDWAAWRGRVDDALGRVPADLAGADDPAWTAYRGRLAEDSAAELSAWVSGDAPSGTRRTAGALGLAGLPPGVELELDAVDGRAGAWLFTPDGKRVFETFDQGMRLERRVAAGVETETRVTNGATPPGTWVRARGPEGQWGPWTILRSSGPVTEVYDESGRRTGTELDARSLLAAKPGDKALVAHELGRRLASAAGFRETFDERVGMMLGDWLGDSFGPDIAESLTLSVLPGDVVVARYRMRNGEVRVETARLGEATSFEGKDMGRALVITEPAFAGADGRVQGGGPKRWREYLSRGGVLDWNERVGVEGRGFWEKFWTSEKQVTTVSLTLSVHGPNGEWRRVGKEARGKVERSLVQEGWDGLAQSSYFGAMGTTLNKTPVLSHAMDALGWAGMLVYGGATGYGELVVGSVVDNPRSRLEGIISAHRARGQLDDADREKIHGALDEAELIELQGAARELRAARLNSQGLTRERLGAIPYENLVHAPLTREEELRAIDSLGAGTHGRQLISMAGETSGDAKVALYAAGALMSGGESIAQSLPAAMILGALGNVKRLETGVRVLGAFDDLQDAVDKAQIAVDLTTSLGSGDAAGAAGAVGRALAFATPGGKDGTTPDATPDAPSVEGPAADAARPAPGAPRATRLDPSLPEGAAAPPGSVLPPSAARPEAAPRLSFEAESKLAEGKALVVQSALRATLSGSPEAAARLGHLLAIPEGKVGAAKVRFENRPGELGRDTAAHYDPETNEIIFKMDLREVPTQRLLETLTHEVQHHYDDAALGGVPTPPSVQSEARAHEAQSLMRDLFAQRMRDFGLDPERAVDGRAIEGTNPMAERYLASLDAAHEAYQRNGRAGVEAYVRRVYQGDVEDLPHLARELKTELKAIEIARAAAAAGPLNPRDARRVDLLLRGRPRGADLSADLGLLAAERQALLDALPTEGRTELSVPAARPDSDLPAAAPRAARLDPGEKPKLTIGDRIVGHRDNVLAGAVDGRPVAIKLDATPKEVETTRAAHEAVRSAGADNVSVPALVHSGPTKNFLDNAMAAAPEDGGIWASIGADTLGVFRPQETMIMERLPAGAVSLKDALAGKAALGPISRADFDALVAVFARLEGRLEHGDLTNLSNIQVTQSGGRTHFHLIDWDGRSHSDKPNGKPDLAALADARAALEAKGLLGDSGRAAPASGAPRAARVPRAPRSVNPEQFTDPARGREAAAEEARLRAEIVARAEAMGLPSNPDDAGAIFSAVQTTKERTDWGKQVWGPNLDQGPAERIAGIREGRYDAEYFRRLNLDADKARLLHLVYSREALLSPSPRVGGRGPGNVTAPARAALMAEIVALFEREAASRPRPGAPRASRVARGLTPAQLDAFLERVGLPIDAESTIEAQRARIDGETHPNDPATDRLTRHEYAGESHLRRRVTAALADRRRRTADMSNFHRIPGSAGSKAVQATRTAISALRERLASDAGFRAEYERAAAAGQRIRVDFAMPDAGWGMRGERVSDGYRIREKGETLVTSDNRIIFTRLERLDRVIAVFSPREGFLGLHTIYPYDGNKALPTAIEFQAPDADD